MSCELTMAPGRPDSVTVVFKPLGLKTPFRPLVHLGVGTLFGVFGLLIVVGMLDPSSEGPVWIGLLFGLIFIASSVWVILPILRRMLSSAVLTIDSGRLSVNEHSWPRRVYAYQWEPGDIVDLQINEEVVDRYTQDGGYNLKKPALRLRVLDRQDHEYLVLEGRRREELDWLIALIQEQGVWT